MWGVVEERKADLLEQYDGDIAGENRAAGALAALHKLVHVLLGAVLAVSFVQVVFGFEARKLVC